MNENKYSDIPDLEAPPVMFDLPSDAPPPLPSIRGGSEVTRIHDQWRHLNATRVPPGSSLIPRQIHRVRSLAHRFLGRSDHEFLADLTRAVDAVAARCDEISDQLSRQQLLTQNIAESLGQELTRLRALIGLQHETPDH